MAPIGIPDGRPGGAGRRGRSSPPSSAWRPRRGAALDQVQLRAGGDRRRLARPDRRRADVLAGGDPGRRRLRDRRRAGRPRADLRGGPAGGDVGRLPGRRRLPGAGLGEGASCGPSSAPPRGCSAPAWAATRARSSWRARSLAAIEAPLVLDADGLNAFAGSSTLIAAARRADDPHPARGRAGPAARPRLARRSPPTGSPRRARPPPPPARSSSSRATTRSSPTASGSRSTRSRRPPWPPPAPATCSPGITAALLARGLEPFAAACAAVLAHARAGRDAATRIGAAESVIATDVIDSIPAGMLPGSAVE